MVAHVRRPLYPRPDDTWVSAVNGLASNPKSTERAITTIMLLGIPIIHRGMLYVAGGDRLNYGGWDTEQRAAVAYCVAEGIDIET